MASLSDQKMKEIEAEMNRFEEEISGTGGRGLPPPPPPPNPMIIGARTFQAVQKKISVPDAPGAPEKTAPLVPPPPPPPMHLGPQKPLGLSGPPPPPPAAPAFRPPQLRHRHPPPPPSGMRPLHPGMQSRMPPPRPHHFMGRPPMGPPGGGGGPGGPRPPLGSNTASHPPHMNGPPNMGGPQIGGGPAMMGGPRGPPGAGPPQRGMGPRPPMGAGGPPMRMAGPPMAGGPRGPSPDDNLTDKEVSQPGVTIAKKGVTYKPEKTAEELEQEEMDAKFLAMERELKAEKKAKKSTSGASSIEMNVPAENMHMDPGQSSSQPPIVVPEIDVEAFVAKFQRDKAKSEKAKKRKFLRTAAGETWEDSSLEEWDQDDFRVFCGDLGNEVTDEVLARAFSRYPTFQKARVVRDKRTNKTKGFGFISFKDPNDFMKAIREMNGKYVGNRPIKLRKSSWRDRQIDVARRREKEKKKLGYR